MSKMFGVNMSSALYVWTIHVEKLGQQLDCGLGSNVDRFHERNDEGGKKLEMHVSFVRIEKN
jgi:hypothetical protein